MHEGTRRLLLSTRRWAKGMLKHREPLAESCCRVVVNTVALSPENFEVLAPAPTPIRLHDCKRQSSLRRSQQ
jgi:hypothetical protein